MQEYFADFVDKKLSTMLMKSLDVQNNSSSNEVRLNNISKLKKNITQDGYAIVRKAGFFKNSIDDAKQNLLNFMLYFGTPLPHNKDPLTLIWDIKPDLNAAKGFVTHSQRSDEAYFHTDSAFCDVPEDLFCLYTLRPAQQGGESFFLHMDEILKILRSSSRGRHLENVLRTKPFPFTVPEVFKKHQNKHEYNLGCILDGETIRYRDDVINFEVSQNPAIIDQEQKEALAFLKCCIEQAPNKVTLKLETDDLVLVDNKRMLHGRTSFEDQRRHLVRVRLNAN